MLLADSLALEPGAPQDVCQLEIVGLDDLDLTQGTPQIESGMNSLAEEVLRLSSS